MGETTHHVLLAQSADHPCDGPVQNRLVAAYIVRTLAGMTAKAERLHLRLDAHQKALLEAASEVAGASVSTFVLAAATEAATDVLADRRAFVLDQQAWRVFDEALERPASDVAGLRELLAEPTVLDQRDRG